MKKSQVHLIDEEVDFPANEQLVSTTDLQGVITYANDHFCRVAGYSRAELIGQHHNMVRHPDMPKAAFADLWGKLKQGKPWRGRDQSETVSVSAWAGASSPRRMRW